MTVLGSRAIRWRDEASGESGNTSTQVVLVVPALLLLVMLVVQFALWQHAGHLATAAAQRGVTEGQAEHGTAASARREATRFLARAGGGVVVSPQIRTARSRTSVRVTVSARVTSLVPGIRPKVVARAAGPVERFVPRSRR